MRATHITFTVYANGTVTGRVKAGKRTLMSRDYRSWQGAMFDLIRPDVSPHVNLTSYTYLGAYMHLPWHIRTTRAK